jgi:hypothetical protein
VDKNILMIVDRGCAVKICNAFKAAMEKTDI